MKQVVHLSTHDRSGGAALAAWRLHEGLRRIGVESRMVSRHRSRPGEDVSCIASGVFEAADLFQLHRVRSAQPPGATFFSFTPTSVPLMEHPWIAAADVIHLHWVAGFLSPEDIEALCQAGKTVFWTFHDQWTFTGGCHYIGGVRREAADWEGTAQIDESLHELARIELARRRRIFGPLPIHVIAPSTWMAAEAAASGVFAPERIHVVPNALDHTIYHHGLSDGDGESDGGAVSLLFGCRNLGERRKGYQELREALILCMSDPRFAAAVREGKIRLLTFGGRQEENPDLPLPVEHLGLIAREDTLADILRNSSAFVCPSLDDNLPNVVMESLACGLPVIAFHTGGVPDMVAHDVNGLLATGGDVAGLARHLTNFCLDAALGRRLREGARATDITCWTRETQARRLLGLYESACPAMPDHANLALPQAPPLLTLEGRIHPHFAMEFTRLLPGSLQQLKADSNLREQQHHKQLQDARARLEALGQKLGSETAALVATRERLWETKDKLMAETRKRKDAAARLRQANLRKKALKQDILSLKQQLQQQRPFHVRVWSSLRKRLRNAKH